MMTGVSCVRGGLPATAVLRLGPERAIGGQRGTSGDETVAAAVAYPPRREQVSHVGTLMSELLARYGIVANEPVERFEAVA